jgi:hypothetical protein
VVGGREVFEKAAAVDLRRRAGDLGRTGRGGVNLPISAIERDLSIQCREHLNIATVNEYAEAMAAGNEFPPIVVFGSGVRAWIGDGWHRLLQQSKSTAHIGAEVRDGGRIDAVKHALGANAAHGNRRTNADKRRCVEIALREFSKLSSRAIAEMCGVSDMFVGGIRGALQTDCNATVTTTDGRQYPARRETNGLDVKFSGVDEPLLKTVGWIDDEPKHDPSKLPKMPPPSRGMQFARIAIWNLEQIPEDDTELSIALQTVKEWINDKQIAAHN